MHAVAIGADRGLGPLPLEPAGDDLAGRHVVLLVTLLARGVYFVALFLFVIPVAIAVAWIFHHGMTVPVIE